MNLKEEEMLMSNSFYQKDLTDTQRNKIKFLFEKSKKDARRLRIFATLLLVSTNCPHAFSILSCLTLLPFIFNLQTVPNYFRGDFYE